MTIGFEAMLVIDSKHPVTSLASVVMVKMVVKLNALQYFMLNETFISNADREVGITNS